MVQGLSLQHGLIGTLFRLPRSPAEWDCHRLSDQQLDFYRENGYLVGVRLFTDDQVEVLQRELEILMDRTSPGHGLFYEFHSNEATNPDAVLFHALGGWRITPGFHDILWNPAITAAAPSRPCIIFPIPSAAIAQWRSP